MVKKSIEKMTSWYILGFVVLLIIITLSRMFITWHDNSKKDSALTQSINQIPEQHLFGSPVVVSITSLQLHLLGTVQAQPEKFSRAMIAEAEQPAKVYAVGDSVASGVRIHSITADSVILENGGRLEKLLLQRPRIAS